MTTQIFTEIDRGQDSQAWLDRITDQSSPEEKLRGIESMVRDFYDSRRQEMLDQEFHINDEFVRNNPEEAQMLKEQFLEDKKGLNIGETFALSLQEPYFGRIYLTKLASTDHKLPGASKKMFDEMRDFVDWMRKDGPLKGVDPYDLDYGASQIIGEDVFNGPEWNLGDEEDFNDRWRSGRWMSYGYFHLSNVSEGDLHGDRVAIERIRPFANAQITVRDEPSLLKVYKSTVFTMSRSVFMELYARHCQPSQYYPEFSNGPEGPISHDLMKVIERYMYTDSGEGEVQRIHTAIFSAVYPVAMADVIQ